MRVASVMLRISVGLQTSNLMNVLCVFKMLRVKLQIVLFRCIVWVQDPYIDWPRMFTRPFTTQTHSTNVIINIE